MDTCKVSGYILSADNNPLKGILVNANIADFPGISADGTQLVHTGIINAVSSSTGLIEIDLIQNLNYDVVIRSMGYYGELRVPTTSTGNLWELLNTPIIEDDTPDDSGESGW